MVPPSPGSSCPGGVVLFVPASATSVMLALRASPRLDMLPVPSVCRPVSLWPPTKPPADFSDFPPPLLLLPKEMDCARGLCRRSLSQFFTLELWLSVPAESGVVVDVGKSGEESLLALLPAGVVSLVWSLWVKGRRRERRFSAVSVDLSASSKAVSLAACSSFASRFSSALAAFSSSFRALASCLSSSFLALSSSVLPSRWSARGHVTVLWSMKVNTHP